jgi:hypothetical protein
MAADRGRHLKRYGIIAITLRYYFELSHNAFIQLASDNLSSLLLIIIAASL